MSNAEALEECEPAEVTVYDGSVYLDRLMINNEDGSFVSHVYDNLTVDGIITYNIHPNLHKREAYQCTPDGVTESSCTDLVISRLESSVRFGESDHTASMGTVIFSRGLLPQFDEDINDGLGIHFDMEDNNCVVVYTNKDDPSVASHGVWVMAPNFIPAQDKEFTPVTSVDRCDYTKIEPDDDGNIRNIHVKGSMIIDKYIILSNYLTEPLGGWYFGEHSHLWFQPSKEMVIPEKQHELEIAEAGDLVISRGNASVVVRSNGGLVAAGPVAVIRPTICSPDRSETRTIVIFQ